MTTPFDQNGQRIDVRDAARLARVSLTEEESRILNAELSCVHNHLSRLDEIDTTGVLPLLHLHEAYAPTREDTATVSLPRKDALCNAPEHSDGFVRVPRVL